jgi:ABC-2 type transport system ATP-binding protein
MVNLESISKNIGTKEVLQNVDLSISPGQIAALCGPNGAGKTTIVRIILKVISPDSGTIKYSIPLNSISFLLHSRSLFGDLTLKENIDFFLKIKGIPLNSYSLEKYLNILSLEKDFKAKVSTFSEGMAQKADILRALLEKPDILILDEPTSHLDPMGKIEVRKLLKNLVKEEGTSILLTSHLLHEIEKIADDVLILSSGKIRWRGVISSLIKDNVDLESKYVEIISGKEEINEKQRVA